MTSPTFRTLAGRFGLLYALVFALLIGMSGLVTHYLSGIRVDSQRLVEEAREQTISAQLLTEIDALVALLSQPSQIDPAEFERGKLLLSGTAKELGQLEAPPEDPSRPEHQEAEDVVFQQLAAELDAAVALLTAGVESLEVARARGHLITAHGFAAELMNKARQEALEANDDLQARAGRTRRVLFATWGVAAALLALAMALVHRGVVLPIQRLRASTERFGQGDRDHRVEVESTDELGDLARSFNAMADRLARSQDDLENRVRQRTREFIRAARLADLGVLASGIAHEINTPLASIATSAEGLQRRLNSGGVEPALLAEYAKVINQEAFRAREITTRMLALVRQEPSEVAAVSLALIVEQAGAALRYRAEAREVRLNASAADPNAHAQANAGELVQILINLLGNAIDASPKGAVVDYGMWVEDDSMLMTVVDHGHGIAEADLETVFEPFFTTKSPGQGTGLGLALVATLVESHGGSISVASRPTVETRFDVRLPLDWN